MFSTKSTLVHSLMFSLPEVAAAGVVAALEAAVARGAAAVEAAGAAAEVVAAEALEAASPALGWWSAEEDAGEAAVYRGEVARTVKG